MTFLRKKSIMTGDASKFSSSKKKSGATSSKDGSAVSPISPSQPLFDTAVEPSGNFDPENIGSTSINLYDEKTTKLRADAKILHEEFPGITYEESIRFLTNRTMKSARKQLEAYLEWKETYRVEQMLAESPTFQDDSEIWEYAVSHSLTFFPGVQLEKKLPRYARMVNTEPKQTTEDRKEKDSEVQKRMLYMMPGLIDIKIASLDLYALVFAMYFYLVLDRQNLEYVNILGDNRSSDGWGNHSAATLFPISKIVLKHLDHFPQRLQQFYVYPVPLAAKLLWSLCKKFMKAKVVAKVNIHWGSDVMPTRWKFDQSTMELLDKERSSAFH